MANAEQAEFWNSEPGRNWVACEEDLDAVTVAASGVLVTAARAQAGERVLDIGCGTGASSFALAEAVGPSGRVLGVDISGPMLARADERRQDLGLGNVGFELADAEEHRFEPASFDLAVSRFGVMFFADPVAAFRNIRVALRPGGRVAFVAWAGPERNPWFTLQQQAAVARLGPVPAAPPDAPGPMAFRDIDRVCGLLRAAGFAGARGKVVAVELHHPGGIAAVLRLAGNVGPVAQALREKGGAAEGPRGDPRGDRDGPRALCGYGRHPGASGGERVHGRGALRGRVLPQGTEAWHDNHALGGIPRNFRIHRTTSASLLI